MYLGNRTKVQAAYSGLGEIRFEWEREIYQGVNLRHTMSYNDNKDQKTYTVDFNPKTTALKPVVSTGIGTVLYGCRLTTMINHYESIGQHVVFAFNGDGYDTSNGIPLGISINDGKLLTSGQGRYGFGFNAAGELQYGSSTLPMSFTIEGGSPITLAHVNKERKEQTSGVYFLTEDFYPTTESTAAGVEVVLTVDPGQDGLRIGQPYRLTVQNVVTVSNNPNKNKTQIGAGKAVLATHASSSQYNTLRNLTPGQKVVVNVNDNSDPKINWSEMQVGLGIFHMLLDNGVVADRVNTNHDVHPRTVMGVRADGSVVLMQNDGRQVGWATGFTYKETVEYLRDVRGCIHVFNFDGGGSSTVTATLPGDSKAGILNRPSDGSERNNANAILFIATSEPVSGSPVQRLHMYPAIAGNNADEGIILENGKMSFNVRATDNNYYPVPFGGTVNYSIQNEVGNIGSITTNGVFTATSGSAKGKIIASYGGIQTSFDIEVTDSITSIERDFTIISVAPGATRTLEFRALKGGVPIIMSNESLTFTLNPSSLGTITASGTFTATSGQGTGNLVVSYKTFSLSIPVEVGRMPHQILDFETDIFSEGWVKRYTNIPQNGGAGEISINTDENFVKHGDASLRIDYDFQTTPLTGTVAIEIGQTGMTVLEGQPTAISSWVYGDGNGGWYRVQLKGGIYVGDEKITWQGWRYIETPIPENAEWPITLQYPVRLIGKPTVANNTKGTIYIDSVRAIYGFKNDDNDAPVIADSSVTPANGSATGDRQQTISLRASDAKTGINRERTQMYINGTLVDNLQQIVNPDGSVDITYNPSALTLLSLGQQNVKVRVEDNFGNKTFKEWSFNVTSSALNVSAVLPEATSIAAGQTFSYKLNATNTDSFTNMSLVLRYNKDSVDVEEVVAASGVTVNQVNDTTNGRLTLTLSGMNAVGGSIPDLLEVKFKAKGKVSGSTDILVETSEVTASGSTYSITLPNYSVPLSNLYTISIDGMTYGNPSVITVKEGATPVVGASVVVRKGGETTTLPTLTNSEGKLVTNALTGYPVGTALTIYAVKGEYYSNELNVNVLGSTGLVSMVEGASIRVKTETSKQGLRFTATLSEGVKNNEHGFYLVYGKTTISELSNAVNNQGSNIVINGKTVYKVTVPGYTETNQFSVVLTGIPVEGYLDSISVIAYVLDNGVMQYVEAPVSRCVTEVALRMHKENLGGQDIKTIIENSNTNARVFAKNAFGQYEVVAGLYETNNFNLRLEFIADWNDKFATTFAELDATEFYNSAKTGLDGAIGSNMNLAASNIYKFFNDTVYGDKWGWLLDFLKAKDGTTHASRQIDAIKGNGTNEDYVLWFGIHLSYSIANFFNQAHEVGGYHAIDFTEQARYSGLNTYNYKVLIDPNKYLIAKPGVTIDIPNEAPTKQGYNFEYYMADTTQVMPGAAYTLGSAAVFAPVFTAINYSVKYYDGATEYTTLASTYNIETQFDLPVVNKEGYSFVGWYDNASLEGTAILSVGLGSTGDKKFYAKFEEIATGNYTITYELNGGNLFLGYSTSDAMKTAFLTDFHTYLVSKGTVSMSVTDFIHGTNLTSGYNGTYNDYVANLRTLNDKTINPAGGFVNQPEYHRWLDMVEKMNDYVGLVNSGQTNQFWTSNYTAKPRFKEYMRQVVQGSVTADFFNEIPDAYQAVELISQYSSSSPTIKLPKATKAGYRFDGWYDNADCTGTAITEIPQGSSGNKKYYAKWSLT